MGGKPTAGPRRVHSTISRRKVEAPRRVTSRDQRPEHDGVVAVSVHDEITRDYAVDPPTD